MGALRLVAINVAVLAAIALFAEAAWRLVGPETGEAEFLDTSLAYLAPCARTETRNGEPFVVADEGPERRAFAYPLQKRAGTTRIAIVGESSAAMLGYRMSEAAVALADADEIDVINCADPGSALEHVQRRAREAIAYDPDVLVVVFGHNVDFEYPTGDWRLRVLRWRARSRFLSGIAHWRVWARPLKRYRLDERLEALEGWLRSLAGEARERGVAVLVTTLPSNLWAPPTLSGRAESDPRYLAARYDYARGDTVGAIAKLEALCSTADPAEALWHYVLGRWLVREDRIEEAKHHLSLAVDAERTHPNMFGPNGRDRASSAVNEVIRRVADEEGLLLRDTAREMEANAFEGLLGFDLMADHCHLHRRVVYREALIVLDVALERASADGPRSATRSAIVMDVGDVEWMLHILTNGGRFAGWSYGAIAAAVEQWLRNDPQTARTAVTAYLGSQVEADPALSRQHARLLTAIAEGYWHGGLRAGAGVLNEGARNAADVYDAWLQAAVFAFGVGDEPAARRALERAVALGGAGPDAQYFLARLDADAGADPGRSE